MTGDETEPDIEGIMKQLMGGGFLQSGWEGIENAGQAIGKNRDDLRDQFSKEHEIIRDTFSTEQGQRCLELFLDQTMRRSAWPAEMNFGMEVLTTIGIFREGQNAFVAAIIEAFAAADKQDETKVKPRNQA